MYFAIRRRKWGEYRFLLNALLVTCIAPECMVCGKWLYLRHSLYIALLLSENVILTGVFGRAIHDRESSSARRRAGEEWSEESKGDIVVCAVAHDHLRYSLGALE